MAYTSDLKQLPVPFWGPSTATLTLLSFTSRYQVPGGVAEDSPRIFSCARIRALDPKPETAWSEWECSVLSLFEVLCLGYNI